MDVAFLPGIAPFFGDFFAGWCGFSSSSLGED
jgi:hypothetical protein